FARDSVAGCVRQGGGVGRELGIAGQGAVDIDANANDGIARAGLDENAADLAPRDLHVIGPLNLSAETGVLLNRLGDGQRACHNEEVRWEDWAQHQREGELLSW